MNFTASFILEMVNNLTAPAREAVESLRGLGRASDNTAEPLEDLSEEMEDVQEETEDATDAQEDSADSMDRLGRRARALGGAIRTGLIENLKKLPSLLKAGVVGMAGLTAAGVGALTTLTLWVRSETQRAEGIVKSAKAAGVAAVTYQKLAYIFAKAGLEGEALDGTIVNLARRQKDAMAGQRQSIALFASMGIRIKDAAGRYKTLDMVLGEVADHFQKLPDGHNKLNKATLLFGEAGGKLIPTLNEGSAGLKAMGDQALRMGLILGDKTLTDAEKFNSMWELTTDTLRGFGLQLFAAVLPGVSQLVTKVSNLIVLNKDDILKGMKDGIDWLTQYLPPILDGLAGMANFLKDVIVNSKAFLDAVGGIAPVLDTLAVLMIGKMALGLMATTTGIWGMNAALLGCPLTWIIAAIAGIAVAAYFIIRHWGAVKKWLAGFWDWLGKGFNSAVLLVVPFIGIPVMIVRHWSKITKFFGGLFDWISKNFMSLPLPLKLLAAPIMLIKHWDTVKAWFGKVWGWLSGVWKGLPPWMQIILNLPLAIITHWKELPALFTGLWNAITSIWKGLPPWMKALVSLPLTAIALWKQLAPAMAGVWAKIAEAWSGVSAWFGRVWQDITTRFKEGIDAVWNVLPEWFRKILKGIAFGIRFITGGPDLTEGLKVESDPAPASPQSSSVAKGPPQSFNVQPASATFNGQGKVALALDLPPGVKVRQMESTPDLDMTANRGWQMATP